MNVYSVRTEYPHIGDHSGYCQLIWHLRIMGHTVVEKVVPMVHDRKIFYPEQLDAHIEAYVRKHSAPRAYHSNDFCVEWQLCCAAFFGRYDIVHYLEVEHGAWFAPRWLKSHLGKRAPRIVATFHQPARLLKTYISENVLAFFDAIILLSSEQKEAIPASYPPEKIHVVPHGVDTDYFSPADKITNIKSDKIQLLTAGNWLRDYTVFSAVVAELNKENVVFHIVNRSLPDDFATGMDSIIIHSDISDAEFVDLYRRVDALFLPLTDAAANNVILEALACGTPIISRDLPAVREYVGDECGFLAEHGTVEMYVREIRKFIATQNRAELKTVARNRAQCFAWERIAKKIIEVVYN